LNLTQDSKAKGDKIYEILKNTDEFIDEENIINTEETAEIIERIMVIWDFCIRYRRYLKIIIFSPQDLYDELQSCDQKTMPILS